MPVPVTVVFGVAFKSTAMVPVMPVGFITWRGVFRILLTIAVNWEGIADPSALRWTRASERLSAEVLCSLLYSVGWQRMHASVPE